MEGVFFKKISKNSLKTPTQRGFEIDKWHRIWSEVESIATERDQVIYNAGVIFNNLLSEIRNELQFLYDHRAPKISYKELIMAYISISNRDRYIISRSVDRVEGDVHSITNNNNAMGNDITIQEMSDAALDGVELAIKSCLTKSNNNKDITSSENSIDIIEFIKKEAMLSQLYGLYSEYWNTFLWNKQELIELDKEKKLFCLKQPKNKFEIGYLVSQIRRSKLDYHSSVMIHKSNFINQFDNDKFVIIETKGKKNKVKVSSILKASKQVRYTNADWRVKMMNLMEDFPEATLSQNFKNGFSILDALDVFRCLIILSSQYNDRYPENDGFYNLKKLLEFCPKINKTKLILALKLVTGYSILKVNRILDFIQYDGRNNEDLWCNPIVSISESEYSLVTSALLTPVIIRVVEHWFAQLNIEVQDKGFTYEKNVINSLNQALSENSYINDYDKAISKRIKINSVEEEIDLLVRIGETILVGEAKSIVTTDSAISQYRTINTLKHAAKQVKRKTKFIEDNIKSVFKSLGWFYNENKEYSFSKCIINSGSIYVGFDIENVPVCDEIIINKYFESNVVSLISCDDCENVGFKNLAWFKLYNNIDELQKNLDIYLCNPPQISVRKFMYNDMKLPFIHKNSYKIIVRRLISEDLNVQELFDAKHLFPLEMVNDLKEKLEEFKVYI